MSGDRGQTTQGLVGYHRTFAYTLSWGVKPGFEQECFKNPVAAVLKTAFRVQGWKQGRGQVGARFGATATSKHKMLAVVTSGGNESWSDPGCIFVLLRIPD